MEITSLKLAKVQKIKIANTKDIYRILSEILKREGRINREKEHLWFIGISARDYILCIDTVVLGSYDEAIVQPINVFRNGIWKGAKYAIIAHNHPSGILKPSKEDIRITDRLYQCGLILDLPIKDHIIVSEKGYYSFEENGVMTQLKESIEFLPPYQLKDRLEKEKKEIERRVSKEIKKIKKDNALVIRDVRSRVMDESKQAIIKNKSNWLKKGIKLGFKDGIEKGELLGFQKGIVEIGKIMKKEKISVNVIEAVTGLSKNEIDKL